MLDKKGFSTRAIHTGQEPDAATGAVIPPLHLSTNFVYDGIEESRGYSYTRYSNPTRGSLEKCIADLEYAKYGFAFSSGIAAIDVVLRQLDSGSHIILGGTIYGGTIKLLTNIYKKMQDISFDIVNLSNPESLSQSLRPNTKVVWLESPSNPHFHVFDIAAISKIAHQHGALCVVDNTVATPYLQNPLVLGADVVVHSATKYLGGHSDVLGGLVVTRSEELAGKVGMFQSAAGAVLSPFSSYLVLRGIKTLELRMQRHSQNAMAIAEMLEAHPNVEQVNFSGLKSHSGHALAKEQMSDFGGIMSAVLSGGQKAVSKLVSKIKLFTFAESLGAVESIISHPATMSHTLLKGTDHEVDEALVRISVGIENPDDLIADLEQAL